MKTSTLRTGDLIEVDIRGLVFPARFDSIVDGRAYFQPKIPVGHHSCPLRAIRRRLARAAAQ